METDLDEVLRVLMGVSADDITSIRTTLMAAVDEAKRFRQARSAWKSMWEATRRTNHGYGCKARHIDGQPCNCGLSQMLIAFSEGE